MSVLDVGRDFSRFPVGRLVVDGPFTGEAFREKLLAPAFRGGDMVTVRLDNTVGYGSSFLEEAFGGLVRVHHFTPMFLKEHLVLETSDELLRTEILGYINSAMS